MKTASKIAKKWQKQRTRDSRRQKKNLFSSERKQIDKLNPQSWKEEDEERLGWLGRSHNDEASKQARIKSRQRDERERSVDQHSRQLIRQQQQQEGEKETRGEQAVSL